MTQEDPLRRRCGGVVTLIRRWEVLGVMKRWIGRLFLVDVVSEVTTVVDDLVQIIQCRRLVVMQLIVRVRD